MTTDYLSYYEYILVPLFIVYVYFIAWWYQNIKKRTNYTYKWFLPGLTIKLIGGTAYIIVFKYYYGFGDTFTYFRAALRLVDIGINDFGEYLSLLTYSNKEIINYYGLDWNNIEMHLHIESGSEEWFLVRILSVITFISFKSFILATLIFCCISFIGAWLTLRGILNIQNRHPKAAYFAVFFIPSVLFWGSGIMKDTLALASLGFIVYGFSKIKETHKRFISIIFILLGTFICYKSKSYVILSLIPAIGIGTNVFLFKSIKSKVTRYLITPIISIIIFATVAFLFVKISQGTKYSVKSNAITSKIKGFHSWHTHQGGASYDLNITDYSLLGMLKKFPAAINVAYFRPYFWEINSPIVALQALEAIIMLLLTFNLIRNWKKLNFRNSPFLTTLLFYSIILGFITGLISYNFGALARYKMPVSLSYGYILIYSYFSSFSKRASL